MNIIDGSDISRMLKYSEITVPTPSVDVYGADANILTMGSYLPKSIFQRVRCAFRFLPCLVVGMPVAFAIFLLAFVIPSARFQLNPFIF